MGQVVEVPMGQVSVGRMGQVVEVPMGQVSAGQ
jgi:hypothetical protein